MRRTWSDRWLDFVVSPCFFWGTGAAALALTAWAAQPLLTLSVLDISLLLFLAILIWPVVLLIVIAPAGLIVTVACALADALSASHRRP